MDKTDGQIAYEAYYRHCGGRSVHGAELPDWEHQDWKIKEHWQAAAAAVAEPVHFAPSGGAVGEAST